MHLKNPRIPRFLCAATFLVFVVGCAKPIDPTTSDILGEMSKRTNTYFQFLIKSYGTDDCRYSSKESQKYWRDTNGDLRVIDARLTVVEGLQEVKPEYDLLKGALVQMQKTQKTFEGKATKCLDPEALAIPWVDIQSAINDLGEVANFKWQ